MVIFHYIYLCAVTLKRLGNTDVEQSVSANSNYEGSQVELVCE